MGALNSGGAGLFLAGVYQEKETEKEGLRQEFHKLDLPNKSSVFSVAGFKILAVKCCLMDPNQALKKYHYG